MSVASQSSANAISAGVIDAIGISPIARLLGASSFEIHADSDWQIKWHDSNQASYLLRVTFDDLPKTLTEFLSQSETDQKLEMSSLKGLIEAAQLRVKLAYNSRYFEFLIEAMGSGRYQAVLRDITQELALQDTQDQSLQLQHELGCVDPSTYAIHKNWLRSMASHKGTHIKAICPDASELTLSLEDQSDMVVLYGAPVMAEIERELLRRLSVYLPETAIVAHQKSGQISILLPDLACLESEALAQSLTAFPIQTSQGAIKIKLSMKAELLADKDRHSLAISDKRTKAEVKATSPITEKDILELLNGRHLLLALQPICCSQTLKPHHYEALMRINDPIKGPISAWKHILVAEQAGLVHLMDNRALERAVNLLLRHDELHLAVNISASTIGDIGHQSDYIAHLRAYPSVLSRLTIEMTETMAVNNLELVRDFAAKIREMGCSLSIDDFGVGYTSFQNLMGVEARQVKLDGDLITGIRRSRDKQNFVRLMVDFAQTFNVKTVAERIETIEEVRLLSTLGVDYLQGYYLGRPILETDFKPIP